MSLVSSPPLAPALVAASHGTDSPEGRAAIASLVAAVAASVPSPVLPAFVDVQQPDVPSVLAGLETERDAVVVPLLLSAGYHVHVDLAEAAEATGAGVASALGPDDRLVDVLVRRLEEAGLDDGDVVVLAAAGSTEPRAVEACRAMGRRLSRRVGHEVLVGFISAAEPTLADAVASARAEHGDARVVVSRYLLAPGCFSDLAAACGADLVTAPLLEAEGEPPREIVSIVASRFAQAMGEPVAGV